MQGHYSRGNNAYVKGKHKDFIAVLKQLKLQSSQDCPPILNALSQCDFTAFLMAGVGVGGHSPLSGFGGAFPFVWIRAVPATVVHGGARRGLPRL